jgi:hypothetical protein
MASSLPYLTGRDTRDMHVVYLTKPAQGYIKMQMTFNIADTELYLSTRGPPTQHPTTRFFLPLTS